MAANESRGGEPPTLGAITWGQKVQVGGDGAAGWGLGALPSES